MAFLHGGTSVTARILLEKVKNAMLRTVLRPVRDTEVTYSEIACMQKGSRNHRADIIGKVFIKHNH